MLGNGPDDFQSVDETFVLEKFNDQPLFVMVEDGFLSVILADNVGSGRKFQWLARVNLQRLRHFIMFVSSDSTFVNTNVPRKMCVHAIQGSGGNYHSIRAFEMHVALALISKVHRK